MSRATALLLDPDPASIAIDGSVHGPRCYDDGTLTCGWPEQHDQAFTEALPFPQDPDPVSIAIDGSVHGPRCYDDGTFKCGWPEQHDQAFTEALPFPQDQPVAVARSTSSLVDRLMTALLVAAAVVAVAISSLVWVANLHFQTVLSGSMRPTFSAGDVVVIQAVPISSLRVGDVISFSPPNGTEPVIHRITSLKDSADGVVITTRGDANPVDDLWLASLQGTTGYRLVGVVPFIGWLTELRGPVLILAGLLVGLLLLREITRKKEEPMDRTESSGHSITARIGGTDEPS